MGEKTRKKENPHKTYRRDALALAVGLALALAVGLIYSTT